MQVLMMVSFAIAGYSYFPCDYSSTSVTCDGVRASTVLDVFIENKNNPEIRILEIENMDYTYDPMTDDMLNEILVIVAFASINVTSLRLVNIPAITAAPNALEYFHNLQTFEFSHNSGVKNFSFQSLLSSSSCLLKITINNNGNLMVIGPGTNPGYFNQLQRITINHNGNLSVIEPGAFAGVLNQLQKITISYNGNLEVIKRGTFSGVYNQLEEITINHNGNLSVIEPGAFAVDFSLASLDVSFNKLSIFSEAVFRTLLSSSAVRINAYSNPIQCTSCSWAWLLRDNRHYLPRILGSCEDSNGQMNIEFVDISIFETC